MSLLHRIISQVAQSALDYDFLHYQYEPLGPNEIRFVRFKYVNNKNCLFCELQVMNINDHSALYTAISYCWGSSDSSPLFCA